MFAKKDFAYGEKYSTIFLRIASAHELYYMVVNLGVYVPLNNTNFSRVASYELDYMVVNLGVYEPLNNTNFF